MDERPRAEALLIRLCAALEELIALHKAHARPRWAEPVEPITHAALKSLSPAENELLASVLEGLSNKEIAARRATSIKTVKGQLTGVYKKLGVPGRAKLVARWRMGPDYSASVAAPVIRNPVSTPAAVGACPGPATGCPPPIQTFTSPGTMRRTPLASTILRSRPRREKLTVS